MKQDIIKLEIQQQTKKKEYNDKYTLYTKMQSDFDNIKNKFIDIKNTFDNELNFT